MSSTVNSLNQTSNIQPLETDIDVTRSRDFCDYQNCWYPITFVQDFLTDKPYSLSLYDQPLVLFRDASDKLVCLKDLCPHRAAKLSDGQLIDGKVECLYHGWQFGADGECLHIPQLEKSATIPKQACVESYPVTEFQGIIWIWFGNPEIAAENPISVIPEVGKTALEKSDLFVVDTVVDLPYDQDFLIENLLDPAHVPISHDRTELGMKREFAAPLEMEIISSSSQGFIGRYRRGGNMNKPWTKTEFFAPCLVKYQLGNENSKILGGFALYAVPLGTGKCRVLVRRYGNFFSRWFKLQPLWLEHLRQNKLLEEDLAYIVAQQEYIQQSGQSIQQVYLPLKSCDTFVIEHRKWLDKFGKNLPYYQGYNTSKISHNQRQNIPNNRFSRHTKNCNYCYRTYQEIILFQQILIAVAISLAGLAIITDNRIIKVMFVLISIIAVIKFTILKNLQTRLEKADWE